MFDFLNRLFTSKNTVFNLQKIVFTKNSFSLQFKNFSCKDKDLADWFTGNFAFYDKNGKIILVESVADHSNLELCEKLIEMGYKP